MAETPSFVLSATDDSVIAGPGIPDGVCHLKLFLNGVAVWYGDAPQSDGIVCAPIEEIASAMNMSPAEDMHLPSVEGGGPTPSTRPGRGTPRGSAWRSFQFLYAGSVRGFV